MKLQNLYEAKIPVGPEVKDLKEFAETLKTHRYLQYKGYLFSKDNSFADNHGGDFIDFIGKKDGKQKIIRLYGMPYYLIAEHFPLGATVILDNKLFLKTVMGIDVVKDDHTEILKKLLTRYKKLSALDNTWVSAEDKALPLNLRLSIKALKELGISLAEFKAIEKSILKLKLDA